MIKYIYFVAFEHVGGYGHAEVESNKKINNIDQIDLLSEKLRKENDFLARPVILNFKLLREEEN